MLVSALEQVHGSAVLPGMASRDQDVGRKGVSCSKCGLEDMRLQGPTKRASVCRSTWKTIKPQMDVVPALPSSSFTWEKDHGHNQLL